LALGTEGSGAWAGKAEQALTVELDR
jgi:hypothetical protein